MSILNLTHRFPKITLLFIVLVTAFYAIKLPQIKTDSSINSLFIHSDPEYIFYEEAKDWFGSDSITSIVFKDKQLYSSHKLALIQNFVYSMETWQEVEKVDSLFTSTHFENVEKTLQTVPLLDFIPESKAEIDQIKSRALNNPFFSKTLINTQGDLLTVNISIDKAQDKDGNLEKLFASKLEDELDKLRPEFDQIFQLGRPMLAKHLDEGMHQDITYILPISILLILIILFLTMKSGISAIFPIITGVISIIWTIGQMAILDIPIQMLTSTIPLLLLVIGSTEDTHIIAEYDEALEVKKNIADNALNYLSQKISIPIFLTTITTAIGFGTIVLNDIKLLTEFGIACSIGMIFNFIITIALGPILLKTFIKKPSEHIESTFFEKLSDHLFAYISAHTTKIILLFSTLVIAGLFYSTQVITNNSSINMLKSSNPLRKNLKTINNEVGGLFTYFLVLEAPQDKNFKDYEIAELVFKIEQLKEKYPEFISAQSYTSLLALIHREFTEGADNKYEIPKNTKLIHQYFLFISPDDLRKFLTLDYKKANIVFRHNIYESIKTLEIQEKLTREVENILDGSGIKFHFTGSRVLTDRAIHDIINSQTLSILIISACVFLIILFLFRDFKIAALSLIPNLAPILALFAIMGAFGIYLDVGTCNVAAVAIGIAADDTLHFLSRFEQNLKIYFDKKLAIQTTIKQEIRPISCTSFALMCGLAALGFCTNMPAIKFGTLLAFCIGIAFISDIFITPLLMLFIDESKFISITEIFRYRIAPYIIKSSHLFRQIDIKTARNMIINGRIIEFEKGQTIDKLEGNQAFFIIQGEIESFRVNNRSQDNNEKVLIQKFTPGQVYKTAAKDSNLISIPNGHCKALIVNKNYIERMKNNYPEASDSLDKNFQEISLG